MEPSSEELDWSPASKMGASFCTHALVRGDLGKLEFRPTFMMKLFYLVFRYLSLAVALFFFIGFFVGQVPVWCLMLVSLVTYGFYYVSGWLEHYAHAPRFFDKSANRYVAIERSLLGAEKEVSEALSAIKLLQILPKTVSSSDHTYTAYELNLVLGTGQRRTLVSHACYDQLKKDARLLQAEFGFPLIEK